MSEQPAAPSDDQLMAEMNAGDAGAFRGVYHRYCDRAYAVALAICRDDGRAQEAVQDAFLAMQVITLAFYEQLTHAEIAAELGLPAGMVKGRMRLGLQKLRRSSQQTVA